MNLSVLTLLLVKNINPPAPPEGGFGGQEYCANNKKNSWLGSATINKKLKYKKNEISIY